MSLIVTNPDHSIQEITAFLASIVQKTGKQRLVVAVSGGIDSALSLTLAVRAVGAPHVHVLLLPYKDQSTADGEVLANWNAVPSENIHHNNIASMVDTVAEKLQAAGDPVRLGNIMARTRMIAVYDLAKQLDALVCGTENKSEKYLGYFTRFGDEASDIEPLQHLYKTQVRQLVKHLRLPDVFLEKPPSAELWQGQTDEQELGFSYQEADSVLAELVDGEHTSVEPATKAQVLARVTSQRFKHEVPYTL